VKSEPISPPLIYNVTFFEFNEIDSLNQNNNCSASSWSGFMSNYSLFNFLSVLTKIKNATIPFSSVFLTQESDKHLNSLNVFSLFSFFNSQNPTVDSSISNKDLDFEELLFHFMYDSSFPFSFLNSSLINNSTETTNSQEEFKTFAKLSVHVFSSSFSFFYALC
jgi:hypothetical protein